MNNLGIFFGQKKPPFKAHSSHDNVGNHVHFSSVGFHVKRRESLHSALVESKANRRRG